jgi:hypothetical protein
MAGNRRTKKIIGLVPDQVSVKVGFHYKNIISPGTGEIKIPIRANNTAIAYPAGIAFITGIRFIILFLATDCN